MDPELYKLAADPAVEPETLASLAFHHPELWSLILLNPACYPELRDWIVQQPDYVAAPGFHPAVDEQAPTAVPQSAESYEPLAEEAPSGAPSMPEETQASSASKIPVVAILAVAVAVVLVAAVVAAATGNLGGLSTATGIGVSREQGCQNLVDALMEIEVSQEDADSYFEDDYDLEDWDALMGDYLYGVGDVLSKTMGSVSKKIGNREVRAAWDDYANYLQRVADPSYWLSGDLTEESVYEMMEEEAMYLERLDTLCPNVVLPDSIY